MKNLRVLLVDDEIMIREGFKRLFDWQAHDCEVVGEAGDGMEALAKIDNLRPDIVIMDINIPIMNGLKVIQLSRIKHPNTAFVIVSGYDDFSYCREALRLQITDYILKPVNYEEFGGCIDNLKISLFEHRVLAAAEPEKQEERTITGGTVGLWGLPRVHQGIQKGRGHHPLPVPAGFSGHRERKRGLTMKKRFSLYISWRNNLFG